MAILKNGILGPVSGKVGGKVFSSWNGVEVVKDLPQKTTQEPTQLQLDQRDKFALLTAFFAFIKEVIGIGFKSLSKKMTTINAAVKFNKDVVTGDSGNFSINYSQVSVSMGDVLEPEGAALKHGSKCELIITWCDQVYDNDGDDRGVVLFYNETINKCYVVAENLLRKDLQLIFTKDRDQCDDIFHVWFFIKEAKGNNVSKSIYLGKG